MAKVVKTDERWVHLRGIKGECPVCGAPAHPVARVGLRDGFGFWAHDSGYRYDGGFSYHGPGSLETMIGRREFSILVKEGIGRGVPLVAMKRRPVRCLETGKIHPSMAHAARSCGGTSSGVSAAAESGREYHGRHWAFDESEKTEIEARLAEIAAADIPERGGFFSASSPFVVEGLLESGGEKAPEGVAVLDDGFAVKNRLPASVCVEFKTESQWRMVGFVLKDGARAVPMHPSGFLMGETCDYYHVSDVEALDASSEFADAFAQRQENLAELISVSVGHGGLKANFPWCDGF